MSRPIPTDAELQILKVLWKAGHATVREVYEALGATGGYTTVLKTMQIMAEKRLVARDENNRSHVYRATVQAEPTEKRLVGELVDRAFDGSAAKLAMRALSSARPSREELAEVRRLLDRLDEDER